MLNPIVEETPFIPSGRTGSMYTKNQGYQINWTPDENHRWRTVEEQPKYTYVNINVYCLSTQSTPGGGGANTIGIRDNWNRTPNRVPCVDPYCKHGIRYTLTWIIQMPQLTRQPFYPYSPETSYNAMLISFPVRSGICPMHAYFILECEDIYSISPPAHGTSLRDWSWISNNASFWRQEHSKYQIHVLNTKWLGTEKENPIIPWTNTFQQRIDAASSPTLAFESSNHEYLPQHCVTCQYFVSTNFCVSQYIRRKLHVWMAVSASCQWTPCSLKQ